MGNITSSCKGIIKSLPGKTSKNLGSLSSRLLWASRILVPNRSEVPPDFMITQMLVPVVPPPGMEDDEANEAYGYSSSEDDESDILLYSGNDSILLKLKEAVTRVQNICREHNW